MDFICKPKNVVMLRNQRRKRINMSFYLFLQTKTQIHEKRKKRDYHTHM